MADQELLLNYYYFFEHHHFLNRKEDGATNDALKVTVRGDSAYLDSIVQHTLWSKDIAFVNRMADQTFQARSLKEACDKWFESSVKCLYDATRIRQGAREAGTYVGSAALVLTFEKAMYVRPHQSRDERLIFSFATDDPPRLLQQHRFLDPCTFVYLNHS